MGRPYERIEAEVFGHRGHYFCLVWRLELLQSTRRFFNLHAAATDMGEDKCMATSGMDRASEQFQRPFVAPVPQQTVWHGAQTLTSDAKAGRPARNVMQPVGYEACNRMRTVG